MEKQMMNNADPVLADSLENKSREDTPAHEHRPRSVGTRISILIRRIHLYSGLFLLPWVIMYGVTGAMFNHFGLFPRVSIQRVGSEVVDKSPVSEFPGPDDLALRVVEAIKAECKDNRIELSSDHGAEFTNDLMFEMKDADGQHVVYIDPISKSSWIVTQPKNSDEPERLLESINSIQLDSDPQEQALETATQILLNAGKQLKGKPQPFGWTKLNFIANVNDEPARVTYVLKDGHVDINRFAGDDGIPLRQFLLRMHTSHGQPPHWNGRMFWSVAVDTMAIAMVGWGLSGLFMWWQLKRTRMVGTIVIGLSLLTATLMWMGLQTFYATTRL